MSDRCSPIAGTMPIHPIQPIWQAPAARRRGGVRRVLLYLALGLVALSLCGCSQSGTPATSPTTDRWYSVAALQAHIAQDPKAWAGRTVRVHALAEPCPAWGSPHNPLHCAAVQPILVDPDAADLAEPLPLVVGRGNPLLAFLRRLPIAGRLVPSLPHLRWETLTTYRVRLRATPTNSCVQPPCYAALLLDAAPGSS